MKQPAVSVYHQLASMLALSLVLLVCSCYPERQATLIDKGVAVVKAPTKVFLGDASIVLFPEGFKLQDRSIQGMGVRYSAFGNVQDVPLDHLSTRQLTIPQDSAVAMTYYESV